MLESVSANGHSFEFCKEELKKSGSLSPRFGACSALTFRPSGGGTVDIVLDAGFKDFYKYCKEHDIPVVIISRHARSSAPASLPRADSARAPAPRLFQRDGAEHPRGALEPHRRRGRGRD